MFPHSLAAGPLPHGHGGTRAQGLAWPSPGMKCCFVGSPPLSNLSGPLVPPVIGIW